MKTTSIGTHLDWIGISASLACAIHCMALPFLLSALPILGLGFLANPWIEYLVIVLSLFLAAFAISHGFSRHHRKSLPILLVVIGFSVILAGLVWGHGHGLAPIETAGPVQLKRLVKSHRTNDHFITPIGAMLVALGHFANWLYIRKSKSGCLLPEPKHR
ncbi:MerC domain-containing protein [Algoriphagus sp. H41]|uniref:MerC domain-containing protein n=1 Tax=Algoriphagus oliviformis TaxID=2811231 RepID=A0ABS3C3X3_9BACT|nr:MerC domain-containing protein [Algoriphagus oliviformis]MBN7811823.1 MerC domain-containing protein [Algoriphagus oliviformis]